jgi:hypothetical protein
MKDSSAIIVLAIIAAALMVSFSITIAAYQLSGEILMHGCK